MRQEILLTLFNIALDILDILYKVPKIRNPFATSENVRVLKKKSSLSIDYGLHSTINNNQLHRGIKKKSLTMKLQSPQLEATSGQRIPKIKSEQSHHGEGQQKSRYDHYLNCAPKYFKFQPSPISPSLKNSNLISSLNYSTNNKQRKIIKKKLGFEQQSLLGEDTNCYKKSYEKQHHRLNKLATQGSQYHSIKINKKSLKEYSSNPAKKERKGAKSPSTQPQYPNLNDKSATKTRHASEAKKQYMLIDDKIKTLYNSPKIKTKRQLSIMMSQNQIEDKQINSARSPNKKQEIVSIKNGQLHKAQHCLSPQLNLKKPRTHSINSRKSPHNKHQGSQRLSYDSISVYFPQQKFKFNQLKVNISNLKKKSEGIICKNSIANAQRNSISNLRIPCNNLMQTSPSNSTTGNQNKSQKFFRKAVLPPSQKAKGKPNFSQQRQLVKPLLSKSLKKDITSNQIKMLPPNEQNSRKQRALLLHTEQANSTGEQIKDDIKFLDQNRHKSKFASGNDPALNKTKLKASLILPRQQAKRSKNLDNGGGLIKPKQQKLVNPFRQDDLIPRKSDKRALKLYLPSSSSNLSKLERKQISSGKNNLLPKIEPFRVDQLVLPRLYNSSQLHSVKKKKKVRDISTYSDGKQEQK